MWGGGSLGLTAALAFVLAFGAGCASPAPVASSEPPGTEDPGAELRRQLEAARSSATPVIDPPAPLRPASQPSRDVWVEIERPSGDGVATVRTSWIEVFGFAGTRGRRSYDVVIAIDVSGSTQYASGTDVNGNGIVGKRRKRVEAWRRFDPLLYCSDPGDTVLDAERVASLRLIERLDPRRTRIGIVSFSDIARPRSPLGSSRDLLRLVLDDLAGGFGAGPTNLADATRLAAHMLFDAGEGVVPAPDPVVLILSDGYPTHPESEERAAEQALAAAHDAARAGVRVSSLALGIDEPREPDVFAEMARATGGEHLRVAQPGDVVQALPGIRLAQVERVDVTNLTTGEDARAPRVRPDGTYDAWVRLRPGKNRLRVTARGLAGGSAYLERVVHFDDTMPPDPEELERLQNAIELRTLQIQLEREAREGRAAQRKVIRVEAESAPLPDDTGSGQ